MIIDGAAEYIDQLCNTISNIINIPNKTVQQTIELRVIVIEIQLLFPQYVNDTTFKSFIFKTNSIDKLPEADDIYSNIIASQMESNDFNILMYASKQGNLNLIHFLLSKGADINIQGKNGWTALMFAVNENHKNITKFLLKNNADTDLQNNNGNTALIIAKEKGYEEIVKILSQ